MFPVRIAPTAAPTMESFDRVPSDMESLLQVGGWIALSTEQLPYQTAASEKRGIGWIEALCNMLRATTCNVAACCMCRERDEGVVTATSSRTSQRTTVRFL
jgi:hypothetical protein